MRSPQPPPQLTKGQRENFNTLLRAVQQGDLALISARRKRDGKPVAILCAMQRNEDGTISPVPLALQFAGEELIMNDDPIDRYEEGKGSREEEREGEEMTREEIEQERRIAKLADMLADEQGRIALGLRPRTMRGWIFWLRYWSPVGLWWEGRKRKERT